MTACGGGVLAVPPALPPQPDNGEPIESKRASRREARQTRAFGRRQNRRSKSCAKNAANKYAGWNGQSSVPGGNGATGIAAECAAAESVKVVETGLLPGVTEGGLNVADTFEGRPETLKAMAPANPLELPGVTVIELEADMPEAIVIAAGAPRVKSLIAKVTAGDAPPGLLTVTAGVPPVETSVAGIAAVSCVALRKVVGSALPPKFKTEAEEMLAPLTVSVKPAPAGMLVGEIEEIAGTGFTTAEDASAESGLSPPTLVADTT